MKKVLIAALTMGALAMLPVETVRVEPTVSAQVKGVRHYLGVFDTEELAYSAYLTKKRESHEGNIL